MSALHAGGGAKPWLATFAIGLSTFTVVTAEMLPVGLLTPIVSTLNASIGRAGLLISLPALFAALRASCWAFASAVSGPSPADWRNVWCRRPPSDWRCPSSSAA